MTLLKQMATGGALCVNDCVNIAHRNQVAVSRHLALLWRAGAVIKVPAADGDKRRQCYAIHPSVLRAVPGGKELDFGGMKARWVNWLDMKGLSTKPGEAAYKNITVGRHTRFGFDKGKQVFILEDPDGNPWVMKSFSLITHPDQKFEDAGTLGSRLKLPPGWKFRAPVLEQDLVLTPDKDGVAHITQDDFGNTYDRAGGPYSNFKP